MDSATRTFLVVQDDVMHYSQSLAERGGYNADQVILDKVTADWAAHWKCSSEHMVERSLQALAELHSTHSSSAPCN